MNLNVTERQTQTISGFNTHEGIIKQALRNAGAHADKLYNWFLNRPERYDFQNEGACNLMTDGSVEVICRVQEGQKLVPYKRIFSPSELNAL